MRLLSSSVKFIWTLQILSWLRSFKNIMNIVVYVFKTQSLSCIKINPRRPCEIKIKFLFVKISYWAKFYGAKFRNWKLKKTRDEKRNLRFPCIQWKRKRNFVPVSTVYKGNANFVSRPWKKLNIIFTVKLYLLSFK